MEQPFADNGDNCRRSSLQVRCIFEREKNIDCALIRLFTCTYAVQRILKSLPTVSSTDYLHGPAAREYGNADQVCSLEMCPSAFIACVYIYCSWLLVLQVVL
jgi:hypothetical protein